MMNFNKDTFKELSELHAPHCISIYLPTHRAGMEVNEGTDKIKLKNLVKKAKDELKQFKLSENEIRALLKPVNELLEDTEFWKYQSDGLAIFIAKDYFKYYTLPVPFEEHIYIADHLYLKPLIPLFNEGGKFYLLALSLHDVKLFEDHPYQIDELVVDDLLPERLEEAVGFDYKQKYLQFREGQSGNQQTMFHGHGEGKDDRKEEVLKYFRAVNKGVMKVLNDETVPLVIAAVEYLIPLYKEANEYKNLFGNHIAGNPEHKDPILLHEEANELLTKYFEQNKKELLADFEKKLSDKKAAFKEGEIIPAAINGRVDTLFIKNKASLWGIFEKRTNSVIEETHKTKHNADLLNTAAIYTFLQGGNVYLLEENEMPEPNNSVNAILRF